MKFLNIILLFICLSFINLNAQTSKLPLIEFSTNKIDFGEAKFAQKKCSTLVIKNVGDSTSRLYYADPIIKPFIGNIPYVQDLKAGDSIKVDICYNPFKKGTNQQTVYLRMDTRLSHSIGLLFDVSLSMNEYLSDGKHKIDAATNAGKAFVNSMLLTKTIYDEAAVFEFYGTFNAKTTFTSDKTILTNALNFNLNSSTAYYDAIIKSIDLLKVRKFSKVLIALTDGEDNASKNSINTCINNAKANNIKIYTIGVGSDVADANLKNIAQSTGGEFFRAQTSKELEDIYYKIFNLLSKNITLSFDLNGISSTPDLNLECPDNSKEVTIGDTVQYKVNLKNVDTAMFRNHKYSLKLKFNKTLLKNTDEQFTYNNDGTVTVSGINTINNLDSLPLTTLKFQTLVGDSSCTNIELLSIKWDNMPEVPEITSISSCKLCLYSCVRTLRQIQLFTPYSIKQVTPNPFSDKANLTIAVKETGNYKLSIVNLLGETIIDNLLKEKLNKGENIIEINSELLESGNYYLILNTPDGVVSELISIFK